MENRTPPGSDRSDALTRLVQEALQQSGGQQDCFEGIWRGLQVTTRARDLSWLPSHEKLVVVDQAARIVARADVTQALLIDRGELGERLLEAGSDIVLIHNHLMGRGLSRNDLAQLTNPRVKAVIAVGHDGSLYAASLGEHLKSLRREEQPTAVTGGMSPSRTSVMEFVATAATQLGQQRRTVSIHDDVFFSHFDHVVSLVLGKAGAIDYRFVLGVRRQKSFRRFELEFTGLSDDIASHVAAEMKGRIPTRARDDSREPSRSPPSPDPETCARE